MATTTNSLSDENPKTSSVPDATAPPLPVATDESKPTTEVPTAAVSGSDDGSSVNDTMKKIRRAERFGVAVKFSEQEKRNSRAERFGTGSGLQKSDATKKSEELKRKARAERFGISQSVPSDEDEKKKSRLARFAPASCIEPLEEEKRKARALKFSQSQANGSGKIEQMAAVAGKAGGGD